MAVVNQYKMYGVTTTTAEGPIKFFGTTTINGVVTQNPLINETYIELSSNILNCFLYCSNKEYYDTKTDS